MNNQDFPRSSSAPPRICSACEVSLQMAAKDGRRANHLHFCSFDHWDPTLDNASRAGVLAMGCAQGGIVLRWELTGPLSRQEAKHMADVYLSQAEALGIPVRTESVN